MCLICRGSDSTRFSETGLTFWLYPLQSPESGHILLASAITQGLRIFVLAYSPKLSHWQDKTREFCKASYQTSEPSFVLTSKHSWRRLIQAAVTYSASSGKSVWEYLASPSLGALKGTARAQNSMHKTSHSSPEFVLNKTACTARSD